MGEDEETPWAMVVRMQADHVPLDGIVTALQKRGLSREYVDLLLEGVTGRPVVPVPEPEGLTIATGVGSGVRYLALFAAETAAWVGAFNWWLGSLWGAGTAAVGAGLAAWVLLPELKAGLRRTLKKWGAVNFFVGMFPALSVAIDGWHLWNAPFVAAFAASLPMMVWASFTGFQLKGLRDFVPGATVYEDADVQFVVRVPRDATVGPGEVVELVVLAQNCIDAERALRIRIRGDVHNAIFERDQRFSLLPGCVVELRIAVRPQPAAEATFLIGLAPEGVGRAPGPRVRLDHGKEWTRVRDELATNVAAIGRMGVMGVGTFALPHGSVRIHVDATKPFADEEKPTSVKTLYQPTPAELAKAAKS